MRTLLIAFAISTASFFTGSLAKADTEAVLASFAKAGVEITPNFAAEVNQVATEAHTFERQSNQYADNSPIGATIGNQVLICVKVKVAGLYMKVGGGLCSDLLGYTYYLKEEGLGLSAGASASLFALVYIGEFTRPMVGTYAGLSASSNAGKLAARSLRLAKLLKSIPRSVGPEFDVFNDLNGRTLIMLGVAIGPMVDLSATRLTIDYL